MKINYTKKVIKEISKTILQLNEDSMYLHCKTCIPSKIPKGSSPELFGSYEIATTKIKLPNGVSINVVSIWCKHCKKLVWDSRHLKHAY